MTRFAYDLMNVFWPMFIGVSALLLGWSAVTQRTWTNGQRFIKRDWGIVTTILVGIPLLIFTLSGAAFAYADNDVLLTTTVAGKDLTLGIWPTQGRYFPLFSREFVLLGKISSEPIFYYSFIALQLVVLCVVLNMALAELSVGWRTLASALALSSSGTVILFVEAVYPERNIVFLLPIFIVAVQRFDQKSSRLNMAVALIATQFAINFKEPAFLLFATFAIIRLLMTVLDGQGGWRSIRRRPLELGILAACAIFAVQLAVLVAGSDAYVENTAIGSLPTLRRYLRIDPLLVALLIWLVFRIGRWRRERRIDGVWDPLALGALVYFLALVAKGLAADRYMGPIDLVAAMVVTREVAMRVSTRSPDGGKRHRVSAIAGIAAITVLAAATFTTGGFRIAEHGSVVAGNEKLADFVASFAASHGGTARLYFPETQDYRIMNFAALLGYRHPEIADNITLTAPLPFPGEQCVYYRDFRCQTLTGPEPGDLIVHMPDDRNRNDAGAGRVRLFDYSWLGRRVPAGLGRVLYPIAPLYDGGEMPVDWLEVSVEIQE